MNYPPSYNNGPGGYQGPGGPPPYHGPQGYQSPPPGYPPPAPSWKRPIRHNANIVCTGLLLVEFLGLLAYIFIEVLLSLLLSPELYVDLYPIISVAEDILYYSASFGLPAVIMILWLKMPIHIAIPMKKKMPMSLALPATGLCLGVSIVGGFVSMYLGAFLEMLFGKSPVGPDFSPPSGTVAIVLHFVSIAILPAILEEIVFRGVILQSLRRYGDAFALIVSSVLFSFCHGNLVQGPPTFMVGLLLGYFVLRTGSLKISMFIHFVNNGLSVALDLVEGWFISEEMLEMFNVGIIGFYLLAGIAGLLVLLIRRGSFLRLAPSDYPVAEPTKYVVFVTSGMTIVYTVWVIFVTLRYFA